jgi:hypothetical protein
MSKHFFIAVESLIDCYCEHSEAMTGVGINQAFLELNQSISKLNHDPY